MIGFNPRSRMRSDSTNLDPYPINVFLQDSANLLKSKSLTLLIKINSLLNRLWFSPEIMIT